MAGSISEEIERVWQLLNEGKEAEALQAVVTLEIFRIKCIYIKKPYTNISKSS